MKSQFKYVAGLLAIIAGAVATFDNSLMPIIRYLTIYLSLIVIASVILHGIYMEVEDAPTLEKITDEQ